MSPRHNLSFCACKTAWFAPEWQVYMDSSHYLLFFLHAKQWLYDQTYKSVLVPALNFVFCVQNSNFWRRIKSLYGSLTSPVVLCMQNSVKSLGVPALIYGFWRQKSDFWARILSLYSTRPHLLFCARKSAWLAKELQVSKGSSLHMWFCAFKTADFGWE